MWLQSNISFFITAALLPPLAGQHSHASFEDKALSAFPPEKLQSEAITWQGVQFH